MKTRKWTTKLHSFSVTIFDKIPDFSDITDILTQKRVILDYCKREHLILKTALNCCQQINEFEFVTKFYPVYIILTKYMEVLGLNFCIIKYKK